MNIPEFCRNFKCIAGDCPDNCCKDWIVEVDDETMEFYRKHQDLIENIKIDENGDNVINIENDCPFIDENGLCKIQLKYGHERLSHTCRKFPRITQDYTEFGEEILTLACPEAARLMIICDEKFDFIKDSRIVREDNGYSREYMNFLLKARFMTAEIFRSQNTFIEKISKAFEFNDYVQSLIDEKITKENLLDTYEFVNDFILPTINEVIQDHGNFQVMSKGWLEELMSCKDEKIPEHLDDEFSRIALYYIARDYLNAIANDDVYTVMIRIYYAYVACGVMISHRHAENDPYMRTIVYQRYSKETEHGE